MFIPYTQITMAETYFASDQSLPANAKETWLLHGPETGLTKTQFYNLYDVAEMQYVGLHYHNFEYHIMEALDVAMELSEKCRANGVEVNQRALTVAVMLHDAGYHENHEANHYDTKEEYSAKLAMDVADMLDFDEEEVELVGSIVMATQRGIKPVRPEEKIMVRADLNNVGSWNIDVFKQKTALLWDENRYLNQATGKHLNEILFVKDSLGTLNDYLVHDLSLGPWDNHEHGKQPAWVVRAVGNLAVAHQDLYSLLNDRGSNAVRVASNFSERVFRRWVGEKPGESSTDRVAGE